MKSAYSGAIALPVMKSIRWSMRVAAALLAIRLSGGRLASPFTAREVYRAMSGPV